MIMHSEGRYYALLDHGVGSFYETDDANFNPNTKWGGTWELDQTGTVLVSKSNISGSAFNVAADTVVGEEKHTLNINEMPSRSVARLYGGAGSQGTMDTSFAQSTQWVTGALADIAGSTYDVSHNNIQPSKIVYRWHRTA
jgi:hypothetical protein